jgi:hypothetical protein
MVTNSARVREDNNEYFSRKYPRRWNIWHRYQIYEAASKKFDNFFVVTMNTYQIAIDKDLACVRFCHEGREDVHQVFHAKVSTYAVLVVM